MGAEAHDVDLSHSGADISRKGNGEQGRVPLSCAVGKPSDMRGPLHLGTVQWYDWQSCWLRFLVAPRARKSTSPKANALIALSVAPYLISLSTALKKPRNFAA